jgi:hypothetical protein
VLYLFQVHDPRAMDTYRLILVKMLRAYPDGGNITKDNGIVRVATRSRNDLFVIGIKYVIGIAHFIPEQPELLKGNVK